MKDDAVAKFATSSPDENLTIFVRVAPLSTIVKAETEDPID